jgi:hypothetical protein
MDVSLTAEESAAVRNALRSYLSDLRAEIVDTDNPEFKRGLREERAALEGAMAKLDAAGSAAAAAEDSAFTATVVEIWWVRE